MLCAAASLSEVVQQPSSAALLPLAALFLRTPPTVAFRYDAALAARHLFLLRSYRDRPRVLGHVLDQEQLYVNGAWTVDVVLSLYCTAATSHPDKIAGWVYVVALICALVEGSLMVAEMLNFTSLVGHLLGVSVCAASSIVLVVCCFAREHDESLALLVGHILPGCRFWCCFHWTSGLLASIS